MSSFNRQHHGRSRPPPDRNRPGFHPRSTEAHQHVDPHYLAYLRSQAAHLHQHIADLSDSRSSRRQPTRPYTDFAPAFQPPQVSIPSSTYRPEPKSKRNPKREGSKWRFYAVKNGINGDDVYSSWTHAYPYCWDPSTQYFFPGCFCKGFDTYDSAWDFLLDVPKEPEPVSTLMDSTIPPEPPDITIPSEPTEVAMGTTLPPHQHQDSSNIIPTDNDEDDSYTTYDYTSILPQRHQFQSRIPTKVHIQQGSTNDTMVSTDTPSATPFLTAASEKALPKYSAKSNDDINEFVYKLRNF